jgi:hypothetical protein
VLSEHNKKGKVAINEFLKKIEKYKENIEITHHTLFRLNEKQRKIYENNVLKEFLINKRPLEIWEQENNNLAVFYTFEEKRILKIILSMRSNKVYIVTFYILDRDQMKDLGK